MKIFSGSSVANIRLSLSLLACTLLVAQPCSVFAAMSEQYDSGHALTADQRVAQVLSRLSFGARPGDFDAVKKMGVQQYIDHQLDPDSIDDSALQKRLDKLPTLLLANPSIAELYNPPRPKPSPTPMPAVNAVAKNLEQASPTMTATVAAASTPSPTPAAKPLPTPVPKNPGLVVNELQSAKLLRAVYSERQLNEVMVDFWENHFSIFANKDADRILLTEFDRDTIRPFAMGRFRDLLGATAHSPAMLFYLDNWQSSVLHEYPATKGKPARRSGGINENYARELMELHTLGVDGGYTQKDVQEVARCFTGWTIRKPYEEGIFVYNPGQHDNGEKMVLGTKILGGGGIGDAERVLDILAKHPSTARFIATKLARRFIGDDPPKALIDRAAKVFLRTDGSIGETLKSIIDSPEFLSPSAYQVKVRSPFEYVAASLRATAAESDGARPILDWISKMGQPVFGRVTPDGYPERTSEWLSNNGMLTRFNFAVAFATGAIKGTKIDIRKLFGEPTGADPQVMVASITKLILMDQVSAHTRDTLDGIAARDSKERSAPPPSAISIPNAAVDKHGSATPPPPASEPKFNSDYVAEILALTLGAPEFQRK
ncbi:MAG: DUF1800 family protein [Acidobacteriota bacterium]